MCKFYFETIKIKEGSCVLFCFRRFLTLVENQAIFNVETLKRNNEIMSFCIIFVFKHLFFLCNTNSKFADNNNIGSSFWKETYLPMTTDCYTVFWAIRDNFSTIEFYLISQKWQTLPLVTKWRHNFVRWRWIRISYRCLILEI